MKALDKLGVPYRTVVETHEADKYIAALGKEKVLVAPFSNHGKGGGVARNWLWEHSITEGHERHWVLDDNIREFWRLHNNIRVRVESGAFFRVCEDFVDRYENVGMAGLQYKFFCPDDWYYPPYIQNTRLMSCILLKNDMEHRWRGKYNEDVDLSIRVLKSGLCTIQFNCFLQGKLRTGTVKGGNTSELYGDGTFEKSKMLAELHPDVVQLVRKYDRWHHTVNFGKLRHNKFILRKDFVMPEGINEYGMKFVKNYGTDDAMVLEKPDPRNR